MKIFDLRQMKLDRIVLIIGSKEQDTNKLMEEIKYEWKDDIHQWHVWTKEETLWRKQMDLDRNGKQSIHAPFVINVDSLLVERSNYQIQIVFDGISANHKFWTRTDLGKLFLNARHYQAGIILKSNFGFELLPELRPQISYIFCFWTRYNRERITMYRHHFLDYFDSITDFEHALFQKGCLVLDCIEHKIYSYIPNIPLVEFRLRNDSPPPKYMSEFLRFSRIINKNESF